MMSHINAQLYIYFVPFVIYLDYTNTNVKVRQINLLGARQEEICV